MQTRLNDLCVKHGVPKPQVPEQIVELSASWRGSRAMKMEELPAEPSTELDLDTRHVLVRAGQLGARRLVALMQDDSAFGPGGWPREAQLDAMGAAMQRGFGAMVNGARHVRLPDGEIEDKQRTGKHDERIRVATIGMMVRRRATMRKDSETLDGDVEAEDDDA